MNRIFTALLLVAIFQHSVNAGPSPIPARAPRWQLNTADTHLRLAVWNNRIYIEALRHPAQNWNWAPDPTAMPLIARVSGIAPNWTYRDATVDTANGTLVTLRFTSTAPHLELKSVWRARPGPGPVENWMTVENQTGGDVTYNQADIISANLRVSADRAVTLARFNKCGVSTPPHVGVALDLLGANQTIKSQTRDTNDWVADESFIPFQVLDAGGVHGLYIGYEWSFGKFIVATGRDATALSCQAYLWDSKSFTEADGRILKIPAIYLGTYQGDLDDGGNRFKRWYWRYKVPATLRNDANEPLLEYCVPGSQAGLESYFAQYDMQAWGGELAKIDIDWLAGVTDDTSTWFTIEITNWNPNPAKWPGGMNAGAIAHQNHQKLSLYIPDTYQWVDLGTPAGREAEKAALRSRFDRIGFDYYRSDFFTENNGHFNLGPAAYQGGAFYLSHEGYMEVLDYMIANRPGFRYEHCSGGGTLKDFDTLQRVTVMTTTDISEPDAHRQAMYSNVYCINPAQLKADLSVQGGPGSADDPAWVKYCLRTGFEGANMAISGGFTPMMAVQTKAHWRLYKTCMRPILRGADVYHILPIGDGKNWDGLEYFNPALGANGRGALLLFKPSQSAPEARTVKLKGLARSTRYTLTFQDRTNLNCSMGGADLMDGGISITGMTGNFASEIVWINQDLGASGFAPSVAEPPPPPSSADEAPRAGAGTGAENSPEAANFTVGKNHAITLPDAVALDLVWIAPGTFTMGSPPSEDGSEKWERPQTVVTLTRGFWLGKTPVTQGQYQAVTGNNPSHFTEVGTDAPVEQVAWDDAMNYCRKLTEQERAAGRLPPGYAYTLPTEAQWEYACRAGTTGPRYAENLAAIAWYRGNSGGRTHLVGEKEPNAFGLYDMLGNVWEWCLDYWSADRLPGGAVTDPVGISTSGPLRVFRGGAWEFDPAYCRSAYRYYFAHDGGTNFLGFRVALSPVR